MILYLGTSSLIRLYVEDADSGTVRLWASEAEIIATCRIAYTEAVAALDIRFKNGDLASKDYNRIFKSFSSDWISIAVVDFDDLEAGRLVKKYGLSRLDAMHLSAAMKIQSSGNGIDMAFSSVSERLCRAAEAEGLRVLQLRQKGGTSDV